MDGFSLARRIAACTGEAITYKNLPTLLIGPYFPHETLSIREFIAFQLPPIPVHTKSPNACLSHKPPSTKIFSENDVRVLDCPSRLDVEGLITELDMDDENPLTSVEIGSSCIPIIILEIWRIHFQLWDLQNLWKDSLKQTEDLIKKDPGQQFAIQAAQRRLTLCQWNEEIQGFSSIGQSAIGALMCYLSISCLVMTDIFHHIEILQSKVEMMNLMVRLISPLDLQLLAGSASQ
ncbi:uncharacterized protein EI90DRAFT_3132519 [Cantharellus anzutake]|uniref:uncharacterized protein n=1 Tax=Cantharellus anzutake TaxID=1750568 RepID=UPI0019038854|nr:uncharacterized protein EI90DRAFT_3132519 [Cantharellus anzutake]KAF8319514.1 hypothetical protein EI90DRAFT_3132519 [Cantharellus anzutake]